MTSENLYDQYISQSAAMESQYTDYHSEGHHDEGACIDGNDSHADWTENDHTDIA